jgi:DNA-binding beta-propeller fold protein YncE
MRCSPPATPLLVVLSVLALPAVAIAGPRALGDGFVGCSTSDDCYPFDLASHAPGAAIDLLPEGDYPYDATITPDGSQVWIVGASGDGVVVIDRATNTVLDRLVVADYVIGVAFTNDGTRALVTSRDDESITIIDTATLTIVDTLALPTDYFGAGNIALDPATGLFYVVDWYNDVLFEVAADGSAILRDDDFGTSLWQVVVAPGGGHVYVTDRAEDVVKEIATDTFTITREFPVGDDPWGLDITADGATLVVTCEDSHEAMLIDVASGVVTPVALAPSADPRDVDILDDAGVAFVAGGSVTGYSSAVYVIELATASVVDTFDGPGINANVIAVQAQMHDDLTAAPLPAVATALALSAYPNPFNPQVTVAWRLDAPATGVLAVFDAAGRRVRTLASGTFAAGNHDATWDGRDDSGQPLPSGVYLVSLRGDGVAATRKVVLME